MFVTPNQAVQITVHTGAMLAEAQMVVAMRLFGMAGLWNMAPEEPLRMVQEKVEAVAESAMSTLHAVFSGQGTAAVAMAALDPVRNRTRANMQRLQDSGPGLPF